MKYHRRFKRFNRRTVRATQKLLQGWGASSEKLKIEKMKNWIQDVSEIYQVNFPMLKMISSAGSGCYNTLSNEIFMSRASAITLMHEFRHAMQTQNKAPEFDRRQMIESRYGAEDDARGWSLSLYHKVAPRTFKRLVTDNRVFFVSVEDL